MSSWQLPGTAVRVIRRTYPEPPARPDLAATQWTLCGRRFSLTAAFTRTFPYGISTALRFRHPDGPQCGPGFTLDARNHLGTRSRLSAWTGHRSIITLMPRHPWLLYYRPGRP